MRPPADRGRARPCCAASWSWGCAGRHRRVLRSRDQRGVDRRGVVALPGRAGDRDQGLDPPTGPVGPAGEPGALSVRRWRRPAAAGVAGAHRPVLAGPDRPHGAGRRPVRRARRAAHPGQDPPRGALRGRGRAGRGGAQAVPVASVQNRYSLADRAWEPRRGPPRARGDRVPAVVPPGRGQARRGGRDLGEVARRHQATPAQVALAWLLRRSPVMVPILGTSSVAHLEENLGRLTLRLAGRRGPVVGLPAVSRPTQPSAAGLTENHATRSRSGSDELRHLVASGRRDG